jgi:putative nucleotidyltransferase with HDIG domain
MISTENYKVLLSRFKDYITSLRVPDAFSRRHIDLKVEHTYHVISNIQQIARLTGFSEADIRLAKTIALVHDIGRFQQFITYATFDDAVSINHAELGIKILHESGFFDGMTGHADYPVIIRSVLNHNVAVVNPALDDRTFLFTRLLRDADKLDIWEILTIRNVVNRILEETEQDAYEVPDEIVTCFRNSLTVPPELAQSMNDYRLLRLSWIYDMNFPATFALIIKREYAARILAKIPPSGKKDTIAGIIRQYIVQHAG